VVGRIRKSYEEWFRDVSSTRGYEPPRIHLGTKFENPVTLTRQDWRGPQAGWGPDSLGYWEVQVSRAVDYEITLHSRHATLPERRDSALARSTCNSPRRSSRARRRASSARWSSRRGRAGWSRS